jgi:transposase
MNALNIQWVRLSYFINAWDLRGRAKFYSEQIRSPLLSPDLNPIEWVWSDLKRDVRKQSFSNLDEIRQAITEFHDRMDPEYCQAFIKRLYKVLMQNLL